MVFVGIFILILFLFFAIYYLTGMYFYNLALNPKMDKTFILGAVAQTEEQKSWWKEQFEWLAHNSKDVNIISTNNGKLKLHGYEIDNNSDVWAIVIHGYMSFGKEMTAYARRFFDRKYNVLIPDLRGHGESEGNYVGMGWHDRLDIIDWINYIVNKNPKCKIMLFGLSMGAATTMMTTGEKLPENVKLAIADCGYSSVWDEFAHQLSKLFKLPTFPVLNAANAICKRKAGYSFLEASSLEQLKKSKTPTLFIHGSIDNFVPFKMLDVVYEAAACKKEKLVIYGAAHAESSSVDTEKYWSTIDKFIERYL